jgi:hypothetical protein
MQTALINSAKDAVKLTATVACTFAAVLVGLNLGGKIAGFAVESGEAVAAGVAGVIVGTQQRVGGLLKGKTADAPKAQAAA